MFDQVNRMTAVRFGGSRALGLVTLAFVLTPAFTANAFAGPSSVLLGTASNFTVLAGSGMTNTGVSTIGGDVGSSPTHSETGFGPCPAADCVALTGTNHDSADPNDAVTQQAKTDLTTAYNDAFGRTGGTPISAPLGGGTTLVSGVYTSAADIFVGGDLTLDGGGDPNSVFIFQAKTGTLKTAAGSTSGVPSTRVLLSNGAQACNVFWQVGSSATIGTSTQFVGTILANQSVTVNTGATVETGRALALNGAVTLDTNTLHAATCSTPPGGGSTTPPPSGGGSTTPPPSGGGSTTPPPPGSGATTPPPDSGTAAPSPSSGTTSTPLTPTLTPAASSAPAPAGTSTPIVHQPAGFARLSGPSGAVSGPFMVSVSGRAIAKVTFYIDGRRLTTVHAKRGRKRFSLTIHPRGQDHRVHRVTARVTFTPKSRTTARKLRLIYRRSSPPSLPRFTG